MPTTELTPELTTGLSSGALAAIGTVYWIVILIIHVYMAICLQKMAKRLNIANDWIAWIPVANLFLMIMIAGKPLWWFLLMLIPFVNIVILIIVWMKMAARLGHPSWMGILTIIPLANLILPAYLAFAQGTTTKA